MTQHVPGAQQPYGMVMKPGGYPSNQQAMPSSNYMVAQQPQQQQQQQQQQRPSGPPYGGSPNPFMQQNYAGMVGGAVRGPVPPAGYNPQYSQQGSYPGNMSGPVIPVSVFSA